MDIEDKDLDTGGNTQNKTINLIFSDKVNNYSKNNNIDHANSVLICEKVF